MGMVQVCVCLDSVEQCDGMKPKAGEIELLLLLLLTL